MIPALRLLPVAVLVLPIFAQEHEHASARPERLGTVHFATSCSAGAQPQFDRAVALLHSFEFVHAINGFEAVLTTDPSCAIAAWGIALSRWGNPFATGIKPAPQLTQGREAVARAMRIGIRTERERGYVDAVSELYDDFEQRDQRVRVVAYRDAMKSLAARYPEDREAPVFYALALASAAEPTDKTYASLLEAGAILERLSAEQPDHPGLAHYIIHSYDVPPLAPRALDAARRYAKIAPSAPHALHMPSHTFTRVGSWQESIDTNILSAAAARRDRAVGEELHATDYEMYAYLQTGQDRAAKRLLDSLPEIASRFDENAAGSAAPGSAGVFALAAIPARWTLERRAWTEAATLEPRQTRYPYAEAMTYFARALGAAHTRDFTVADASISALQQLRDRLAQTNETYWADQVDIQRIGAHAWLALAHGRSAEALAEMRDTADREDRTEKSAVTPGPLTPARELLGDMLLEINQPAQALQEFEATLKKEPNRFRTLYGAMHAAQLAGRTDVARRYARELVSVCAAADKPVRPEVAEAERLTSPH